MTRLYLDLGPSFAANISTQRNPLADAITATLDQHAQRSMKRAGIAPAVTLVSSLVTVGGAHAAVFEVENLNDSGAGSLRQAVLDANNNPGLDAITFADGVSGTLTMYNGEMDIYDSVIIQGPGEANLTIDADNDSRIFNIQPNQNEHSTEISGLTLVNGEVQGAGNRGYFGNSYTGGAIRIGPSYYIEQRGGGGYYSRLRLDGVTITDSYSSQGGGALFAEDTFVEILDSTVNYNSANEDGGGIRVEEGALTISGSTFDSNYANEGSGGAASVEGAFSVLIDDTTLSNNYAYNDGGAVYLDDIEVNALISNSMLLDNRSDSAGGAINGSSFNDGAVLKIDSTTITGNSAADQGGGIYFEDGDLHIVNNSVISNNYGGEAGGGIRFGSESTSHELRIEDSTIDNNSVGEYGGGIHFYSEAVLLVRNSSISGNTASYGGGIAIQYDEGAGSHTGSVTLDNATIDNNTANVGGGVFWELDETYAPVLITDSSISNNLAESGNGGGLFLYFDDGLYTSMTIRNTVIDGNYASEDGGGIWFYDDDGYDLVIENSTISNNTADDGGGMWFYSDDGAPIIRNSTISANSAFGYGGGLFLTHDDGNGRIDNSTIVDNYAYYDGGGVFNDNSELFIRSSIIANNSVYEGSYSEIGGEDIYARFSLIENLDGFNLSSNNNNIFYTDPMLGPLADNGGATMTHALMAGSPAIDAGLNIAPSADDQRGDGFDRMVGLQTDMGAVESTTDNPLNFPAYTQLVTNLNDAGAGSLRQAVIDANGSYGLDVIEFQAGLSGTITLTSGDIDIYDSLVINAPVPSVITVSGGFSGPNPVRGGGYERVLSMRGGLGTPERGGPAEPFYNLTSVDIVGLTISDGYDSNGGGIFAYDVELTIRDSVITSNQSYGSNAGGGGIDHNLGVLRILDSTISGNTASGGGGTVTSNGGGIRLNNASLVIRDSYLNSNYANDDGGGLHADRVYSIAITGSTLDSNQAGESGGAIDIGSYSYYTPGPNEGSTGSQLIADSTITGNTAIEEGGGAINIYDGGRYGDALTLDNVSLTGNISQDSDGGAINVEEEGRSLFVLNNTSIMNNTAYNNGGGIRFAADGDGAALIVDNSTISSNTSESDGGGIFFYSEDASLSIVDSTLSSNYASSDGGGIAMYFNYATYQPFEIINTTISNNTAGDSGGGVYLNAYNESGGFGGSGVNGPILIDDSVIAGNSSDGNGGGLFFNIYDEGFYGGITIRNSTIADNTTSEGSGGGVFISDDESNYAFVFDNTTVSGNYASGNGGGLSIYTEDANLFVRNSTFSGNTASGYGGAIAIDYLDDTAFIANSTITNNSAYTGGGIYSNDTTINTLSSIISGNTSDEGGDDIYLNGGEANSLFSILGTTSGDVYDRGFNEFYADPLLAPLADNGGPTETHALMAGSPAINRGFNFVASLTDQRLAGFPRTLDGATDMGAFEANGNPVFSLNVTGSPFAEAGGMATIEAASTEAVGVTTFIDLSFAGVAILDTDFMVDGDTLIIPIGTDMSAGPVTMTGIDDTLFEGDEAIDITGTDTRGPALAANAVITDDDPEPTVTLSLAGSPIAEGGNATVTATLNTVSGLDTTVTLVTSGTATAGDFNLPASIVIPAGDMSADVTLATIDDMLGEIDETVIVDIDTVTNGMEDGVQQVTATIIDDDAPDVSLSLVGDPIAENGGIATITATLSNLSDLDVTADLAFSGTATDGVDFIAPASIVVPNGMMSADITLTAIDDGIEEGDETAIVDISSVTNGTENGTQQVMTTIIDDDGTLVSVSLSVTEIDEGGNADIILTLDEVANGDVDIELGFSGTAMMPEDYTVSDTMVTIPAGETTGTIGLIANLDLIADPNETIVIDIIGVTGGAEDGEQQETLIIRDAPVEVPTLSAVGKWLMMLLLPLAGFLGLRRRRQTK